MAKNGVLKYEGQDYTIEMRWKLLSQSAATLSSTVEIGVYVITTAEIRDKRENDENHVIGLDNFIAYCDIEEIIEESWVSFQHYNDHPTEYTVGKTTVEIKHDAEGVGSMLLGYEWIESWWDEDETPNEECWVTPKEFSLDSINLSSPVSTNGGYVGEEITINISKANSKFTHTLLYEFGSLSGSIIAKTSDSQVIWRLPDEFYAEMPNEATKIGKLICRTYNGSTIVGESTCDLKVMINPDNDGPTVNATIKDIREATLALTGDEKVFVKGESTLEYNIDAAASNYATIMEQIVKCGDKTVSGLSNGIIENVESGEVIVSVVDSRGIPATKIFNRTLIEYLKPTCNQKIDIELVEGTGAQVKAVISGYYFNGTFGAVDNTLKIEMRHTQNDDSMGEWVELTDGLIPEFDGNTYRLEFTISGFDNYTRNYDFQCRATDKLNYVETPTYTLKVLTVFDWGREDFNFNVPVNIEAEELSMFERTVLRHNKEAQNTVLSAAGGHIYMRPGGTNETDGETIIYPDGSTKIGGNTEIDGSINIIDDVLKINEQTVLRHNLDNNTVLSASGGHIYLRPTGTDQTETIPTEDETEPIENETIFYQNGNVKFSGGAEFAKAVTIDGKQVVALDNPVADYVVATGSFPMGSNGTWYWEKWNSGKSVCWGTRNYGRMSLTSAIGSVYKSSLFSQSLPTNLFNANPDAIHINPHSMESDANIDNSDNTIWVVGRVLNATNISFTVCSADSTTLSTSYISIQAIGRWK